MKDVKKVRFQYAEYADNPLTFDKITPWLQTAIDEGEIKPIFKGEDYWYLTVQTKNGPKTASPGDWIVIDNYSQLDVLTRI